MVMEEAKEIYFHPAYAEKTKELNDLIPFQDEIIACYAEYEGKLKKPDLYGKTVRVSEKQFPDLYRLVESLAKGANIPLPRLYIYEDFYYGAEAKGAGSPRIEISAKTLADFSPVALKFLLAREVCRIKHGMVKLARVAEQAMSMIDQVNFLPGKDTMNKSFQIAYASWSRAAHYSADCYGYLATGDIEAAVKTILTLVLNNLPLVERVDVRDYLKQAREIYLLDDVVSRYSQNDEKIPYGPLRIRNLLAFAASRKVIAMQKGAIK